MAQEFLRHFEVSGRFQYRLRQGVAEHVGMDAGADLAADISNDDSKAAYETAFPFLCGQPAKPPRLSLVHSTLVHEVTMEQRPKVIGDRHAMFVPSAFESNR